MKKRCANKKGFTLVELIVVIAILAILMLILIPSVTGYIGKADRARKEANTRSFYTAVMLTEQTESSSNVYIKAVALANLPDGTRALINRKGTTIESVTVDGVTFNGETFTP